MTLNGWEKRAEEQKLLVENAVMKIRQLLESESARLTLVESKLVTVGLCNGGGHLRATTLLTAVGRVTIEYDT